MCQTCIDLLAFTICPPTRAARELDFDAELAFDRELHLASTDDRRVRQTDVDAVTEHALRARLTKQAEMSSDREL